MPSPIHVALADRLEAARAHAAMSMRALCIEAGVGETQYRNMVERLRTKQSPRPAAQTMDRVIAALVARGISADWIRSGEGPMLGDVTVSVTGPVAASSPTSAAGAPRAALDALLRDGLADRDAYAAIGRAVVDGGAHLDALELYRRARAESVRANARETPRR